MWRLILTIQKRSTMVATRNTFILYIHKIRVAFSKCFALRKRHWIQIPSEQHCYSKWRTRLSTGQSRHRISTFVHLIQSFRDSQTISSSMNMFRYFCNVSLFSAVLCALCTPIETRTSRADRVRKEEEKASLQRIQTVSCFFIIFCSDRFSIFCFESQRNRSGCTEYIMCAVCNAFTKNRLDDRLSPSPSQWIGCRAHEHVARRLCSCFYFIFSCCFFPFYDRSHSLNGQVFNLRLPVLLFSFEWALRLCIGNNLLIINE